MGRRVQETQCDQRGEGSSSGGRSEGGVGEEARSAEEDDRRMGQTQDPVEPTGEAEESTEAEAAKAEGRQDRDRTRARDRPLSPRGGGLGLKLFRQPYTLSQTAPGPARICLDPGLTAGSG